MTAEQLYQTLDRAGLTPPCHYCAAPAEWRDALERIEVELEAKASLSKAKIERRDQDIADLEEANDEHRGVIVGLECKLKNALSANSELAERLREVTEPRREIREQY